MNKEKNSLKFTLKVPYYEIQQADHSDGMACEKIQEADNELIITLQPQIMFSGRITQSTKIQFNEYKLKDVETDQPFLCPNLFVQEQKQIMCVRIHRKSCTAIQPVLIMMLS